MYVGNHDLGNGIYNVEILFSQTDDLVISAQHSELSDSFIIEIEAAKVGHLLDEFQNNFEAMATHLKIMNKIGISTLHSYRGSQIFEIVGFNSQFVEKELLKLFYKNSTRSFKS